MTVMDNRSIWAPAKYDCSIVDTGGPRKAIVWSWWAPKGCLLNEWMKEKACEFFFIKTIFFWSSLRFTANQGEGTEISHKPLSAHMHSFPHYRHPHQCGAFLTADEPTLTHHHPEPIVCISVHSWERKVLACFPSHCFFFFF